MITHDTLWMQEALKQAELGWRQYNEVPVGAILVQENLILAKGFNSCINNNDPTAHAEIVTIRKAARLLNNYRLVNTTLYSTLEPCMMCLGAIIQARISKVVFGAYDPKTGVLGSKINLNNYNWNHKFIYVGGLLSARSQQLLQDFFQPKRI